MISPSLLIGLIIPLAALAVLIGVLRSVLMLSRDDPTAWEAEIRKFEAQDRRNGPPAGVVVFTGSSSIRFWTTLTADMAPAPALNRGFGGSQVHQVAYYADRLVLPYQPRGVVFYAGENDLAGVFFSKRKTPAEVAAAYRQFCETVHAALTQVPIYFISIKPPKARFAYWPAMQAANQLIRDYCAADARRHYIDIVPAMLDASGQPRRDVFRWDGIHLNAKGYAIWTSVIQPILAEAFPSSPAPRPLTDPAGVAHTGSPVGLYDLHPRGKTPPGCGG